MTLDLFLVALLLSYGGAEVVYENFTVTANPLYFPKFNVTQHPDGTIDLVGELVRVMDGKFMFKSDCYKLLANKKRQKYMSVPKMNYCQLRRDLSRTPIISDIFKYTAQFGNWTPTCPWKKGVYSLRNMPLDDHFLPMPSLIPKGKYVIANAFSNENHNAESVIKFFALIDVS